MVGWRSGGAQIPRGPSASTQLFSKHFGPRGPENRGGWSSYDQPSPMDLGSQMGSSYSPSQYTQPTLTTTVPSHHSPPPSRRARGVFMDGPVFSSKYQSSQPRPPKYALSKLETLRPPRENGHTNGHSRDSLDIHEIGPLMVRNGYAKPKKGGPSSPPLARKKRRAPEPPTPYPPEPAADYEGYDAPPVPPKPPSILSSSSSSSGSMRKKVSYKEEPEYIERTDHEKAFAEFKDELMKSAEERGKRGNVEPPERNKAPIEDTLNAELKREIVKAAEERAKRPFVEPILKSSELGKVREDGDTKLPEDHPALSDELQDELRAEFLKYLNRRKSGSLRMRKNDKNRVLYTALPAPSVAKAVKKDETKDWVPEQDLVDDVLDGPVTIKQHTTSDTPMPTFLHMFQENTSDMESIQGQYRKGPGSKSSRASSRQGGNRKGKKIKNSFKNAWGSLRRSFGRKNKLKDILNDPQWEIYHAENYDPAPEGPISIHHIETKPAYAYNPHKGQLMLIPNLDRVIVTTDGKQIREDTLTKVAKLGSESMEPIKSLNTEGMSPEEIQREIERREQLRAEIQFQIVRRQVSTNSEDTGPVNTLSNRDNYSSLDRLIRRRDNEVRKNPIYDSDDDDYRSESTESPEEPAHKKRNSKLEDSGYTSSGTPPTFPPNGLPPMIPIAMYPGPGMPQMVPYMVPQWGVPPQQQQNATYTAYVPQQQPPRPTSEISMGSKSTTINIAYEPTPQQQTPPLSPLSVDTTVTSNFSSQQTSPVPTFRPVKFQPLSKPETFEPKAQSPPPPPPPPPIPAVAEPEQQPAPPVLPPITPISLTEPTPPVISPPFSPISSGRTSPYTFTKTTVTKPDPTNKSQVVPDKEMPTFYRRDFYRKLLQGPVGWKPVSFAPASSKERYLVDTDFDTNQTEQTQPRETNIEKRKPSFSSSFPAQVPTAVSTTAARPSSPSPPPALGSDNEGNDDLKREIIEAAERRASKPFVEPVFTRSFDPNNNDKEAEQGEASNNPEQGGTSNNPEQEETGRNAAEDDPNTTPENDKT